MLLKRHNLQGQTACLLHSLWTTVLFTLHRLHGAGHVILHYTGALSFFGCLHTAVQEVLSWNLSEMCPLPDKGAEYTYNKHLR